MILGLHERSSSCEEGLGLSNRFVAFVGTLRVLRSLRSHGARKIVLVEVRLCRKDQRVVRNLGKKIRVFIRRV